VIELATRGLDGAAEDDAMVDVEDLGRFGSDYHVKLEASMVEAPSPNSGLWCMRVNRLI
jgi:hypothetical protein